jgi:PAS domain S-box-containing protein
MQPERATSPDIDDASVAALRAGFDAVPAPVLQLGAAGVPAWANTAAQRALGDEAQPERLAAWWAAAEASRALLQPAVATVDLALPATAAQPGWVRASSQPLPGGGWTVTWHAIEAERRARAEVGHLTELLDLARDFGRLGLWERDAHTLEGRWDRQVLRFRGLAPDTPTPSFEDALANIAYADRARVDQNFRASLRKPGRYSERYSMRTPDGSLRRVHSQWIVKAGADGQAERAVGLVLDDTETLALAQAATDIESLLVLAVDVGRIAIWRHDLATHRMQLNAHGWSILGLAPRPDGIPVDEIRALAHPDDLPRVLAAAAAAPEIDDQPVDMEVRYRRPDGSWRDVLTRRVVQRDASGEAVAIVGVGMDVTDRMEQTRRELELTRRFDLVTRTAGIGHWSLLNGESDARWSEQMRVIYGLAPNDPTPGTEEWYARCVHPADSERLRASVSEWLRSGRPSMESDFRIIRADGEVRQLFAHSQHAADERGNMVLGVVMDVTERRSAEMALRSASERAALATRAAGLGTWEVDFRDDGAFWDEQMWLLRGRTPEPRSMTLDERLACVHPDDRAALIDRYQTALAAHRPVQDEFRVVWPDGSVRWLATRSQTLLDERGTPIRRIGVNWDITDARTAEAMRREREVALRESAAKSKFMARMSHELRTPLNAVLGFAQLLIADENAADAASAGRRRRLEHIRVAGRHLLTLINDVLDLTSLESGELRLAVEPVALAPLVQALLPMVSALQAPKQVTVQLGPLANAVMADPTRLRQVLLNLLSNAVKYNRPGGEVRVQARADGAQVLLQVSDTGRGMDEEQLLHLFEPFNRLHPLDPQIEGSGIGLTIAKSLVERMGGRIAVQSEPGVGSVFDVWLPAPEGHAAPGPAETPAGGPSPAPAAPAPSAPAAAAAAPRHQLLYIEDNPVNALIIGELLARRSDLALHVAADGLAGVARARELRPELILLDMQLPDIDGLEVMRRLRADPVTADIACIALSANAMPDDIERALRAGASDYWTKPLDFRAFMAAMDTLFGKAPSG